MNNSLIKFFLKTTLAVFFGIFMFLGFANTTSAKTSDHVLHGYVWSSNIGWISLNCADTDDNCANSDYKVTIDYTTGELSGYGWSSNIGWVSFQETSGCPFTNSTYGNVCRPKVVLNSGTPPFSSILGWARVVSAKSMTSGAWDGWVSLSCFNTDTTTCSNNYGVKVPNDGTTALVADGALSGYAWGSTVVGWLDFSSVSVTKGSSELTLTASVNSVNVTSVSKSGDKIRLTWSSPTNTNYTSCTASNDASESTWTGNLAPLPSSSDNPPYTQFKDNVNVPTNPTTYTISCTTGSKTDTASVKIDINYVWKLEMFSNPAIVLATSPNNWSDFHWEATENVPVGTNCVATNPNGWTSQTGDSVTERITNITASITRSVTCTPPSPDLPKTASASAKVLSILKFQTDACYRPSDGGPRISWQSPNAEKCYISKDGKTTQVGVNGTQVFANGAGNYSISCTGGPYTVSDTLSATACVPDYSMIPLNMCNGKAGQLTDNSFQPAGLPGHYQSIIKVDSVPESGFSSQLKYKFTMPASWSSNGWSISGWTRVGLTNDYESPIVTPPAYNTSFIIDAPSKAAVNAVLGFLPKKTQTFTAYGDTNPSQPMVRSADYTICAPDGGSSKPIFIEQ